MKEYWPGDSMDGDQARKFQEQFRETVKVLDRPWQD